MRGKAPPRHTRAGSADVGRANSATAQQTNSNDSSSRDLSSVSFRGNRSAGRQRVTSSSRVPPLPQWRPPDVADGILQPSRPRSIIAIPTPPKTLTLNHSNGILPGPGNQAAGNRINSDNLSHPQGQGMVPLLVNEGGLPVNDQAPDGPSPKAVSRPGRRGKRQCERCRRMKQGTRAPCVTDPDNPDGPCLPCIKARKAATCGKRTFPMNQRPQQLATANRYRMRAQYTEDLREQLPLVASFQREHFVQPNPMLSFAPTVNFLSIFDTPIQHLSLQSGSNPHTTTSSTSGFETSAAHNFNENHSLSSEGVPLLTGIPTPTQVDVNISGDVETILASRYPYMSPSRIRAIVADLDEENQRKAEPAVTKDIPDSQVEQTINTDSQNNVTINSMNLTDRDDTSPQIYPSFEEDSVHEFDDVFELLMGNPSEGGSPPIANRRPPAD